MRVKHVKGIVVGVDPHLLGLPRAPSRVMTVVDVYQ